VASKVTRAATYAARDLKTLAQATIDGEEERSSRPYERLERVAPSS
jgi:hypothetical protein